MGETYFEKCLNVAMENLPKELMEIPTEFINLNKEELEAIKAVFDVQMREDENIMTDEIEAILENLRNRITTVINEKFPDGVFVKMSSRSPKDSWKGNKEGFKCMDGNSVMLLLYDSERIMDDIYLANHNNYLPKIILRKWIDMSSKLEFRCFIKDKKIQAVSQYFYKEYIPFLIENKSKIEKALISKFEEIKDNLHVEDTILDLLYSEGCVTVIELNPYGMETDPCLFKWKDDSFDSFEFRIIEEPIIEKKIDYSGLFTEIKSMFKDEDED